MGKTHHNYLGVTHDNICTCICFSKNCVEYKCPYSIWGEDITSAWNKTQFLECTEKQLD